MSPVELKTVFTKALKLTGVLCPDDLEYIFKEIIDDRGGHGDFLKSFAAAFIRADAENKELMMPSALALVVKYGLAKYLPDAGEGARASTFSISADGKSITCQICGLTSHNLNDVREKYCGKCHVFHEDRAPVE